jgi:hypothetical protein
MPKKKAAAKGLFRDRIKDFRRVPAAQLQPNPKNWRLHDEAQITAMRAILKEVGWAGALVVRETPDGYQTIDGHLRADIDPTAEVPVLVLDVSEEEADKILATHDPIGKMADTDGEQLGSLLDSLDFESDEIGGLLDMMLDETLASDLLAEKGTKKDAGGHASEMEIQPFEHYDYVMVVFRNSQDFVKACDVFGLERRKEPKYTGAKRVGLCRVVSGKRILKMFEGENGN